MKRRTPLAKIIIALGLGTALVSCGGVTADELAQHPEAHLFYPGSHVLKTNKQNEQITESGTNLAIITTWLSVDSGDTDGIYAWYLSQLKSKGWTLQRSERINGSFDLYTRGDRDLFQVGVVGAPGEYTTRFSIIPTHCATTPPTKIAFGSC